MLFRARSPCGARPRARMMSLNDARDPGKNKNRKLEMAYVSFSLTDSHLPGSLLFLFLSPLSFFSLFSLSLLSPLHQSLFYPITKLTCIPNYLMLMDFLLQISVQLLKREFFIWSLLQERFPDYFCQFCKDTFWWKT